MRQLMKKSRFKMSSWPSGIVTFLTGKMNECELLNASLGASGRFDPRNDSQAYFYLAARALFKDGDSQRYRELLERSIQNTGVILNEEFHLAACELSSSS
jgi:hypothetical protein